MVLKQRISVVLRYFSSLSRAEVSPSLNILNKSYPSDDFTNVTPKLMSHIGRNLLNEEGHPLNLLKLRIVDYFYKTFIGHRGTPVFSVHDRLPPVVTVEQNFDSLLIPTNHVSRSKSDCYYVNRNHLLRAHMTAHDSEMIKMGFDNFISFGDVYRRDEVDSTHYPVFHQADALRLRTAGQLTDQAGSEVVVFERRGKETAEKQAEHTIDATKLMESELKAVLVGLSKSLFGDGIQYRWVDVYFPFTHPSWELEVFFNGQWLEVLGCGIFRNDILKASGAENSIGWAFGLGLERLAMRLYEIPDIRLFWSRDSGFLSQFKGKSPFEPIKYKPVSVYPQCSNDVSFWLPEDGTFQANDFYELARETGGELVEQVSLKDSFTHPKTGRISHCYRLTYRHLERTLTQVEVNVVHKSICDKATEKLKVTIR